MIEIEICAEGPTEWLTARALWRKKVLNNDLYLRGADHQRAGQFVRQPTKVKEYLEAPSFPVHGYLLMYDQEKESDPTMVAHHVGIDALPGFKRHEQYPNVFSAIFSEKPIALHVADKRGPDPDGNRDFDGYLIDALNAIDDEGLTRICKEAKSCIRNHIERDSLSLGHQLGINQIPDLMASENLPPFRTKSLIYCYITGMQIHMSHATFSKHIIYSIQREKLESIFSSLIAAWNLLKPRGLPDDV